jgi:hypothetical protein
MHTNKPANKKLRTIALSLTKKHLTPGTSQGDTRQRCRMPTIGISPKKV